MSEFAVTSLFKDARVLAYYKLEDLTDSKNSNTLTNNNSVTFAPARFNNGADFGTANTNKSLSISSTLGLAANDPRSFSVWAKVRTELSGADSYGSMVCISHADIDVNYRLGYWRDISVNKLIFDRGKNSVGGSAIATLNTSLGTSLIHHIVGTFNGTVLNLYLDGSFVATATPTLGSGSNGWVDGFSVGAETQASITNFQSILLDDLIIFSGALTPSEVLYIYGAGLPNNYQFVKADSGISVTEKIR